MRGYAIGSAAALRMEPDLDPPDDDDVCEECGGDGCDDCRDRDEDEDTREPDDDFRDYSGDYP